MSAGNQRSPTATASQASIGAMPARFMAFWRMMVRGDECRSTKPRVKIELDVFRPDSERAVILEMGN